jgi:hypothetical protein
LDKDAVPRLPYPPPGIGGYQVRVKTNGLAIASLICAVAGYFTLGIGAIVGVVLGYRARHQIRNSGGAEEGEGLAKAGIIVGYVLIGLYLLILVGATLAAIGS